MREITVHSTQGARVTKINSNATTLRELKTELSENNIVYSDMKMITSERVTLELDDSSLPEGNFTLFMMPMKNKSGAMNRKDCYNFIKEAITANSTNKAFFCEGKNYTNKSTDELNTLIYLFNGKHNTTTKSQTEPVQDVEKAVESQTNEVAPVVDETKQMQESINLPLDRIHVLSKELKEKLADVPSTPRVSFVSDKVMNKIHTLISYIDSLLCELNSGYCTAEETPEQLKERLNREADSILSSL